MALANRFEVINYLDKIQATGKWQPNFRMVRFDMQGMNTLIRMDNGEGKSSLASAFYLLLTRNKRLATEVMKKMSPSNLSSWSHIRIEVIVNDETQPLLVGADIGVTGETWVFGVCGNQDEGLKFYFYDGKLEDLPAGYNSGKIKLLTNKEFYDNQKVLSRVRWEPSVDDYKAALAGMFPPRAFDLGLNLQVRGGVENDDIFPVEGKDPASEIFYNHIAPHLLVSDIPAEFTDGDEEYYFEDTIINSAQYYGRAKSQTEAKRREVEKFERTLQASSRLRKSATEAIEKKNVAELARTGTEAGIVLLDLIVCEQAIPGIPSNNRPEEGLFGDLVCGLVWHATERVLCMQDTTLASVISKQIKHLNEDAMRYRIKCFAKDKNLLVLSPDAALKLESQARYGKIYPIDESVNKILERAGVGFPNGLTLGEVRNLVGVAAKWWRNHCDTNPARIEVLKTQDIIISLAGKIQGLSKEIEVTDRRKFKIEQQISSVEQGKYAWQSMYESNLFSKTELQEPVKLTDSVKSTVDNIRIQLNDHIRKTERLAPLCSSYNEYLKLYPGIPPEKAKSSLEQRRDVLQTVEDKCKEDLNVAYKNKDQIKTSIDNTQRSLDGLIEKNDVIISCQQGNQKYLDIFGEETPEGLDMKVQDELVNIKSKIAASIERKNGFIPHVKKVKLFRKKFPSADCAAVMENAKEELLNTQRQIDEYEKQLNDIQLRLEDLRNHKIAPSAIARQALELVASSNTLHEAICALNITPARKAQVLSNLSAVLFAPVFSDPSAAGKAIAVLERNKLPIPVFMENELRAYAETQAISNVDNVYFSHQAGCSNLTVSTIIDPAKIHGLMEEAGRELTGIEDSLNGLRSKRNSAEEELAWLRDVKQATDEQVESKLEGEEKTITAMQGELPLREMRASREALDAIHTRQKYVSLGGDAVRDSLCNNIACARAEYDTALNAMKNAEQVLSLAQEADTVCRRNLREFEKEYPYKDKAIMDAIRFIEEGGPAFMPAVKTVESLLNEQLAQAGKRLSFNFKAAQQYIDSKDGLHGIIGELEKIKKQISSWSIEKKEFEKEKGQTETAHGDAWARTTRIDEGVAHILGQWKDWHGTIRQITKDTTIHNLDHIRKLVSGKASPLQSVFDAIDQISISSNENSGAERIRQSFEMIKDTFSNIEKKRDDVKRKQDAAEKAHATFQDESQRYLENVDGLSIGERETIASVGDNYNEVISLFNKLDISYNKEKIMLDELKKGVDAITEKAHERLSNLLDSASDNLDLLKKVAKRTADGTIIVETSMINSEDLKGLIRMLLDKAEANVIQRQLPSVAHSANAEHKTEAEWKKPLRKEIAELFYKGVFPTAKVLVKHASVRGGKPTPFLKKDISSGERLAIALVVIGKLQEFIQEREIHWQRKSTQRRRKRGKSQGLLLLDGIFSKLSQKEMIQVAMDAYRGLKGSFQLIGLNHYAIENDHDVFPNYFEVRKVSTASGGFLILNDKYRPIAPEEVGRREGELIVARATITPSVK